MPIVTKTIHPLPFEHLEPKRFEDLIRQLAYDFRPWRSLEATGSSGADEGYDIRGWEIVNADRVPLSDPDEEDNSVEPGDVRHWLIQCKREKEIGPTKIAKYVDDIAVEKKALYGIIVAAACNVSKKARDRFINTCREAGIAECYVWSRAEIEDMLFQPKNDQLLFAYFGISLTVRRRSVATQLRSRLAAKRKLVRAFGDGEYIGKSALFLDPEDRDYPYRNGKEHVNLSWKIRRVDKYHPLGILVDTARYVAFLDDDGIHWDIANTFNDAMELWGNPWDTEEQERENRKLRSDTYDLLNQFPQQNRATVVVNGLLKWEDVVEVDTDGDVMFRGPIIYVNMEDGDIPYFGRLAVLSSQAVYEKDPTREDKLKEIIASREIRLDADHANRIAKFPPQFRKD